MRGDITDLFRYTPEGIVASERAGGRATATEDKLPRQALQHKEKLEALGFVFGEELGPMSTDNTGLMFVACKPPEGWEKRQDPEDPYGRGVYLFDAKGRKRASIFVKLAGYDNYCSISFLRRYGVEELQCDAEGNVVGYSGDPTHVRYALADQRAVFETHGDLLPNPNWREDRDEAKRRSDARDTARDAAYVRLAELHPDYADPFAHWD